MKTLVYSTRFGSGIVIKEFENDIVVNFDSRGKIPFRISKRSNDIILYKEGK
jgi:hypothetical protein